jgi:pseudouridine kinase
MDCKGFPFQKYQPLNRNLGKIQFVHGGVGRNVVENLARLGLSTQFVSTVDATAIGKEVVQRLQQAQVDTNYLREADNLGMGMWMAIMDETGELRGSISQMPDLTLFEEMVRKHGHEIVQKSSHIALEVDLNLEIASAVIALAKEYKKPVYAIPGNLDVLLPHQDLLDGIECFICNNYEADLFFQTDFTHLDLAGKQAELIRFVDQRPGLRSMVVTLGDQGSVYYDKRTNEAGYQPVFPVQLVDTSGAGDSFFSGTVMGLVKNLPLKDAVIFGTKVAGWTIEATENICFNLQEKVQGDKLLQTIMRNALADCIQPM